MFSRDRRNTTNRPASHSTSRDENPVVDPARLVGALRRHWLWILVPPILLASTGYLLADAQPRRYEAEAALVFRPTAAQQRLDGDQSDSLAEREIKTEEQILNSAGFAEQVEARFGDDISVEAEALEDTNLIALTVEAPSGTRAAEAADAIVALYTDERRAAVQAELADGLATLEAVVDELERELAAVDRSLAALETTDGGTAGTVSAGSGARATELRRQQTTLNEELVAAQIALRELENESALTEGDVRIAGPSVVPSEPVSPRPVRSAILWGMLGALLGLGIAWLRDVSDRRLRSPDDLAGVSSALEFAGRIPKPPELPLTGPASLLIDSVADRFRVLANNSLTPDGSTVSIQVGGLRGGEGSTYVAVNLAVTLATGGWRTVLVDADVQHGSIHEIFDVDLSPGTVEFLDGEPLSTAIKPSAMVPGLHVIARGGSGVESTLHRSSFTKMIKGLQARFDAVVIDGPAVLESGDAAVLSHHADKTILVIEANSSTRVDLETAIDVVNMSGGRVSSVVLAETSWSLGKVTSNDERSPALTQSPTQRYEKGFQLSSQPVLGETGRDPSQRSSRPILQETGRDPSQPSSKPILQETGRDPSSAVVATDPTPVRTWDDKRSGNGSTPHE